jgi:predicted RNA-binding Zn ribbon-like protein
MSRAAELTAALVNVATAGSSRGQAYEPAPDAELVRQFSAMLSEHWSTKVHATPDAAERLALMAGAFRDVFTAGSAAQVADILNRLLRRYQTRPYLAGDVDEPIHLHFHGDAETPVESLGGEFAAALALVVDVYGHTRFGVCDARQCDRVYVDLTRNGSRRYCSEACTARAKMAAYRVRQSAAAP